MDDLRGTIITVATFWVVLVEAVVALSALTLAVIMQLRNARLAIRRRVLVNKIDGTAIDAVLWKRRGRLVVLRDAAFLQPGNAPAQMEGEIIVDRDQIDFIQVTGPPWRS